MGSNCKHNNKIKDPKQNADENMDVHEESKKQRKEQIAQQFLIYNLKEESKD